jgi:hypothetical protein
MSDQWNKIISISVEIESIWKLHKGPLNYRTFGEDPLKFQKLSISPPQTFSLMQFTSLINFCFKTPKKTKLHFNFNFFLNIHNFEKK